MKEWYIKQRQKYRNLMYGLNNGGYAFNSNENKYLTTERIINREIIHNRKLSLSKTIGTFNYYTPQQKAALKKLNKRQKFMDNLVR